MSHGEIAIKLAKKTRAYLLFQIGKFVEDASDFDLYRAFCYAFREEIIPYWMATWKTYRKHRVKIIYYLSMEFLPGRIGAAAAANTDQMELCAQVLKELGLPSQDLLRLEVDPGIGNGGLGRLASAFLEALTTQMYPVMGYGLRYQYGLFKQEIDGNVQVERPDGWLLHENPWEFRRDLRARTVCFGGREDGEGGIIDAEAVRALPYDYPIVGLRLNGMQNINTLRLWSTKESPYNFRFQKFNAGMLDSAEENTSLTDVLYPNDQHMMGKLFRIKQEFLLVSASLQDIFSRFKSMQIDWKRFPEMAFIHINDTHPALVIPEMLRTFQNEGQLSFDEALTVVQQCTAYTNHTILQEALECWDQSLLHQLLPRQYRLIEQLNYQLCQTIRKRFPNDEAKVQRMSIFHAGKVQMAHLAIVGSRSVNGVAKLHSQLIKEQLFKDFTELYPDRFCNVTNGIAHRRWLVLANPKLARFITEKIGNRWLYNSSELAKLNAFADDPTVQDQFLEIKRSCKLRLFPNKDPKALFDLQVKRIHEYKRQLLNVLHVIGLYLDIKQSKLKGVPFRIVVFAGKAAASYRAAKNIIQFIGAVSQKINQDPDMNGRLEVHFWPNYSVTAAETLIPAADLSEQISLAGMEASGTGNMKLALNGALTIGTEDGANIEMRQVVGDAYWPFSFGKTASEVIAAKKEGYFARDMLTHSKHLATIVQTLIDGTFSQNRAEEICFREIYNSLVEGNNSDPYFVLADFASYWNTQREVEKLFLQPQKWASLALRQIAAMGHFSADLSVRNYANQIWKLEPCPIDLDVVQKMMLRFKDCS